VDTGSVEPDENGRRFQPHLETGGHRSLTASTVERKVNVPLYAMVGFPRGALRRQSKQSD
jgi:hypothetical protein